MCDLDCDEFLQWFTETLGPKTQEFARLHIGTFHGPHEDQEEKHEYYEIFKGYQDLVEEELQEFIRKQGLSESEFREWMKDQKQKEEDEMAERQRKLKEHSKKMREKLEKIAEMREKGENPQGPIMMIMPEDLDTPKSVPVFHMLLGSTDYQAFRSLIAMIKIGEELREFFEGPKEEKRVKPSTSVDPYEFGKWFSNTLALKIREFMLEHGEKFSLEEQPFQDESHQHHFVFKEYQRMVESELEAWCEAQEITEEQFYVFCKEYKGKEQLDGEGGLEKFPVFHAIMGATDYDAFRITMQRTMIQKKMEEGIAKQIQQALEELFGGPPPPGAAAAAGKPRRSKDDDMKMEDADDFDNLD